MRFDQILSRLAPDAQWSFQTKTQAAALSRRAGETEATLREETVPILDDYAAIIWNDVSPKPTLQECETEWAIMQVEQGDAEIDDKRRQEYGSLGDQLDKLYWDEMNGTTIWVDHITAVKNANPKT